MAKIWAVMKSAKFPLLTIEMVIGCEESPLPAVTWLGATVAVKSMNRVMDDMEKLLAARGK